MPKPYYSNDLTTVMHGDSREIIPMFEDQYFSALICDPPFAISVTKNEKGPRWDRSEIAFRPEFWAAVKRTLRPGANIAVFGHPRTWHHLAMALEGSFQLVETIASINGQGYAPGSVELGGELRRIGAEELAPAYDGVYSSLRPGFQPILIFRNLGSGDSLARTVAQGGTGGFNIGAVRLPSAAENRSRRPGRQNEVSPWRIQRRGMEPTAPPPTGRSASNVVLQHFSSCADEKCDAACPVAQVTAQGHAVRGRGEDASRLYPVLHHPKAPRNEPPRINGVGHPTPKPVGLMDYLVKLLAPVGGIVLDPFAGSGATASACQGLGIKSVSIEIELDYLPLITKRLLSGFEPADLKAKH
jgi:hypothetical protein